MDTPPENLSEAVKVLNDYYGVLSRRIADEIIKHKQQFTPSGTGEAEAILDRHAREVQRLNTVYGLLRGEAYPTRPEGREPLAKDEFRCFGCGGVMKATDQFCPVCGWSWK
jgi:rubrerythrin